MKTDNFLGTVRNVLNMLLIFEANLKGKRSYVLLLMFLEWY